MKNKNRVIFLGIGPVLFLLCCFILPESVFSTVGSRAAIGTVAWMAFWWVTAPVDYAVTAFLPIAVNAVIQMCDMSAVIANYASETILLLLGASILTVSWEETGLDKRIAAGFLGMVGENLRTQLVFWFMLSTLLSSILPNSVVCATVTPIAVSMLKYVGEGDISHSKVGSKLLLNIAYAAGIGGLASPLGGAMNLVTVDYLQQLTGEEYMYASWVVRFFPIMIVLVVSNIMFMLRDVKKDESLGGSKEYFQEEYRKMPRMSFEEKCSLILFLIATVLSFTRQLYQAYLPGLKPAYAFIICAILSFLITRKDGKRLMVWGNVQTKIIWELIYVFAGGLAAGTLINQSGAADAIGSMVAGLGLTGGLTTVFVIITVTLLLSDVTSNTATAAVAMPIVISIIQGIGLNPVPFVYIASVGVNLSYMLPTSIRAIPVGYGLQPKYMFKEGVKMTVMVIILMTAICYVMLRFWPAFSTV
ncbi:MAG: SLC13 family permease [Eubacteriales bacterium]|nr:SLC13 family permease [Eubacteriales bacterium]